MEKRQYYVVLNYRNKLSRYSGTSESKACHAWGPGTVCGTGINQFAAMTRAYELAEAAKRMMNEWYEAQLAKRG